MSASQEAKREIKVKKLEEQLTAIKEKSKTKPKATIGNKIFNTGIDVLSSVKKIQVAYTENNGSYIPGYLQGIGFIGTLKPSFGYVFGSESENLRYEAAKKGWLTLYQDFNEQYTRSKLRTLNLSANIEPVKNLKIDLIANRNYQHNYTENYRVVGADPLTGTGGTYEALNAKHFW